MKFLMFVLVICGAQDLWARDQVTVVIPKPHFNGQRFQNRPEFEYVFELGMALRANLAKEVQTHLEAHGIPVVIADWTLSLEDAADAQKLTQWVGDEANGPAIVLSIGLLDVVLGSGETTLMAQHQLFAVKPNGTPVTPFLNAVSLPLRPVANLEQGERWLKPDDLTLFSLVGVALGLNGVSAPEVMARARAEAKTHRVRVLQTYFESLRP